jgi:hypothetical protein
VSRVSRWLEDGGGVVDESDSIVDMLLLLLVMALLLLRFGEEPVVGSFGEQEAEEADGTGDELYSSFTSFSIFISLLS